MTPREELNKIVRAQTAKIAVDILQAGNYFEKSQYEGFESNLLASVQDIGKLIEKSKTKID